VRQVWYVYHSPRREAWVYTAPDTFTVIGANQTLHGAILPGFSLKLAALFVEPAR